jgi:hypothetical protein
VTLFDSASVVVPASMPMPLPPSQPAALALVSQAHAVKTFHHLSASHFSTILLWHSWGTRTSAIENRTTLALLCVRL